MRRYWRFLITALLAAFVFSVPVYAGEVAAEPEFIYPTGMEELPESIPDPEAEESEIQPYSRAAKYSGTETDLFQELEEKMKAALLAGDSEIDLSEMMIDRMKYALYRMVYYSPYLSNGIDLDCYYNRLTDTYTRVEIQNPMSLKETRAYFLSIDSDVSEILQQVTDDMDAEEKALRIHDFFVCEYEYDQENLDADTLPEDSFRSGGVIRRKTGVCQAYAYAYSYIMNKLGIECHVTGSDAMNHAWNIIRLNGQYYHVDCTWDDPVPDITGRVSHDFFLVSDSGLVYDKPVMHYGWDLPELECPDYKYDEYYWSDITSQIIFDGNSMYYIKDGESETGDNGGYLCVRSTESGVEKSLKDLDVWERWDIPGMYWAGAYSGLFLYNGELYYNTSKEIRKISKDGENDLQVFVPDEKNGYVYGSRRHGNQIEYMQNQGDLSKVSGERYSAPVQLTIAPTQIRLDTPDMRLGPGRSKELGYQLVPAGASAGIQWGSGNPGVASVDENGTVTGVSEGTTVITAETENGIRAQCTVTVSAGKYKVTFDPCGGTVSPGTKETDPGSVYGSLPVPVRMGYQFSGWYTHYRYGVKVSEDTETPDRDHTLYARWTPVTYTIRYHKNGGTGGSMADTAGCKYGSGYILPPNGFTRKGYEFAGWATTPEGAVAYRDQAVVKDLAGTSGGVQILYAKWTPVGYRITYKLNGGKNNKGNPSGYNITSAKITLKNPTRKGCTFKGWYSDSKFRNRVTGIGAGSTGKKTLYAKWSAKKYKITYRLKGGKNHKKNPKSYKVTSSAIRLKNPSRSGYTFAGWYSDSRYKKKVTKIKKGSTGNKILYAKWSRR